MDETTLQFRDLMISFYKRGFIDPWNEDGPNTWGKVDPDHKVQMALAMHEKLGWGLLQFDEKMVMWMANSKRSGRKGVQRAVPKDFIDALSDDEQSVKKEGKQGTKRKLKMSERDNKKKEKTKKNKKKKTKKKKNKKKKDQTEDSDSSYSDASIKDNASTEEESSPQQGPKYHMIKGSKISIIGAAGEAMVHGKMLDQEPADQGHTSAHTHIMHISSRVSYTY